MSTNDPESELIKEIRAVSKKLDRLNELNEMQLKSQAWWRDILRGLLVALGGTVVLGLVLWAGVKILRQAEPVPGVDRLLPIVEQAVPTTSP